MSSQPDIRIDPTVRESRPLTRSEKCSIAGRKGAEVTNARYPAMKREWSQKGFKAFMTKYELTPGQAVKCIRMMNDPDRRVANPPSKSFLAIIAQAKEDVERM